MSKRTKASRKRLNNLLMILLLTAVLLVMSTYAWFTANKTVRIDALEVNVATSSGLQISADGITWKTIIDGDDIKNAYQTYGTVINQMPTDIAPVSTSLTVDGNGRLEMFYGIISTDLDDTSATYGKYLLQSQKQTDIASNSVTGDGFKGYYMAFDVFLRDDLPSETLYMSGSVEEQVPDGGTAKQLENAARVALIKGGNTEDALDVDAVQALTTVGGKAFMWEPNNDAHTQHGIDNAAEYDASYATSLTPGTGNSRIPYDGLLREFSGVELFSAKATNYATEGYFKTMTFGTGWSTAKSGSHVMDMANVTNVNAGASGAWTTLADSDGNQLTRGATKYRIYLWVEGQDVDCENYASGTTLVYNLSFSLEP